MDLVPELLGRVGAAYEAHRDPVAAGPMSRYMRGQFPFLGIPRPQRDPLDRDVLAGLRAPDESELTGVVSALWDRDEREYQYFALRYLRAHARRCSAGLIQVLEGLVTTKSWWDTVDELAQGSVGPLVLVQAEVIERARG